MKKIIWRLSFDILKNGAQSMCANSKLQKQTKHKFSIKLFEGCIKVDPIKWGVKKDDLSKML